MKKKTKEENPIPLILDTSLSFSNFFLVFIAVFVAGVSYLSGANAAEILMRTGISIVILGMLLWALNWRLFSNMIQAAMANPQEPQAGPNEDQPEPSGQEGDR